MRKEIVLSFFVETTKDDAAIRDALQSATVLHSLRDALAVAIVSFNRIWVMPGAAAVAIGGADEVFIPASNNSIARGPVDDEVDPFLPPSAKR